MTPLIKILKYSLNGTHEWTLCTRYVAILTCCSAVRESATKESSFCRICAASRADSFLPERIVSVEPRKGLGMRRQKSISQSKSLKKACCRNSSTPLPGAQHNRWVGSLVQSCLIMSCASGEIPDVNSWTKHKKLR